MAGVPYIFGNATTSIPLSNLDADFNTPVTIGNTTVGLGNTVTTLGNVTLNNVTITSGTINASVTEAYSNANAIVYANASKVGTTNANLTYDGTTFTAVNDASINGLTVGKGGGADSASTAVGSGALATSGGSANTAVGQNALTANNSGVRNASFGRASLIVNTSGTDNSAIGDGALAQNTTGSSNTAVGRASLASNTTASNNNAVGYQAGYNSTGTGQNCFGYQSGYSITTGTYNHIFGHQSGYSVTTGNYNTLIGPSAGYYMTTGSKNTILGGYTGNQGGLDIRTASNYIVLSDGDGNPRVYCDGSGNLFSPQTYAATNPNAANVFIGSGGNFYRSTSSLKYKKNVADSAHGLADLMKLRSVTYQSNNPDNGTQVFGGLIAEEVDAAGLTEFVQYAKDGTPDALAYGNMVSLCIKAIQEQQAMIETLTTRLNALEGK